jgi:hypothetical protein
MKCLIYSFCFLGLLVTIYGESSIEALEHRIEILEKQMKDLQRFKITENQAFASPEFSRIIANLSDQDIEKLADKVYQEEEINLYPWMDLTKWERLQKGMSTSDALAILGKPTKEFPSLHKRVDLLFIYKGRQIPSNRLVEGILKFYKDELIVIERPDL